MDDPLSKVYTLHFPAPRLFQQTWDPNVTVGAIYTELRNRFGTIGATGELANQINAWQNELNEVLNNYAFPPELIGANKLGYEAYQLYLKKTNALITKLQANLEAARALLDDIDTLVQQAENNLISEPEFFNQLHALLERLQHIDRRVNEDLKSFGLRMEKDVSGKWYEVIDNAADDYSSKIKGTEAPPDGYEDGTNGKKNLRENTFGPEQALISFNQLNSVDKLKYIGVYYQLTPTATIFPENSDKGYPCIPNEQSTSPTKVTKQVGGLEVFYTGFLIDKDGPINGFSSFLEVKTQALRSNVATDMKKVEALNQYLNFINRGLELLNQSQANGEKDKEFPDAAHNTLSYLLRNPIRRLYEHEGKQYIVLQYDNEFEQVDGDEWPRSNTFKGRYILVEASAKGIDEFLTKGRVWLRQELNYDGNGGPNGEPSGAYPDLGGSGYSVTNLSQGNGFLKMLKIENAAKEKEILPKNIGIAPQNASAAVYGRTAYQKEGENIFWIGDHLTDPNGTPPWKDKNNATATNVKSWTEAMNKHTQFINSETESINNDVMAMRSKIDTFDSTSSTFRKRAHDTYSGVVGNIR